jgi:hypothetical protein
MKCFQAITAIGLSVLLSLSLYQSSFAQEKKAASPPQVVLRGRVACLDESGHRLDAEKDSNQASRNYELLTDDGKRYKFSADDLLVPMFTESRVRRMELQITALLHKNDLLELIKVLAIKDGKLYDFYYFCDVCNITAYGPGPCSCCFQPLVFIEKPAT